MAPVRRRNAVALSSRGDDERWATIRSSGGTWTREPTAASRAVSEIRVTTAGVLMLKTALSPCPSWMVSSTAAVPTVSTQATGFVTGLRL